MIFLITTLIINPDIAINTINESYLLCFTKIFPSCAPFLLLSNILVRYDISQACSKILGKLFKKLFMVDSHGVFVFIMSFLTGSPSNAKYIKDLYDLNYINSTTINKLLIFSQFVNPIFVLKIIGLDLFNSKIIGVKILISILLSNIISGLIYRKKYVYYNIVSNNNHSNTNFITTLNESIFKTCKVLVQILGIITFMSLIINSIFHYLVCPINIKTVIIGLIEITKGINSIELTTFSQTTKILLVTFFCSFGGFSIHAQIFSIINNKKIRYLPYLICRIITALIAMLLICFLIN